MTANTKRGDAEKCLAYGMDDYLAKPITLGELRQKLELWLPRGGFEERGQQTLPGRHMDEAADRWEEPTSDLKSHSELV